VNDPTIMLGVGATKSGTSWLYRYLADHPDCHFRTIKELHVFDALEKGRLDRQIDAREAEVAAIRARIASGRTRPGAGTRLQDREDLLEVLRSGGDVPAYLKYLSDGSGKAVVVGEVTPAYALVSPGRLQEMARMASDVRFVYLMRDPMARLWSHVRMIARRRGGTDTVDPARAGRILRRTIRDREPEIANRGDYRTALEKLADAVDPSRLLVLVFEDLISGAAIGRLCAFLGIRLQTPDLKPAHVGPPLAMTPGQSSAARDWLAPQYDFVADWLGFRPAKWAYDLAEVR